MSHNFLPALDAEIGALDAELRADPRFVKLQELKRVRALYGAPLPVAQAAPPVQGVLQAVANTVALVQAHNTFVAQAGGRKMSPPREKARRAAADLIRGRTVPTATSEIYAALAANGVTLPGFDPRNNLSALLSTAPEFRSHGRSGWTLEPENAEAANGQIPAQDPLAASNSPRLTNGTPPGAQGREAGPGGGT